MEPNQLNQKSKSSPAGFDLAIWSVKVLSAMVIMVVGAMYGMTAYKLFSAIFSDTRSGISGLMRMSFLAGIPVAIGVLVGFLAKRQRLAGVASASAVSTLSVALFVFGAGAFLREGTICIVMAAPIFLVLAIVGAVIGVVLSMFGGGQGPKLLSVALVLPLLMAPAEGEWANSTAQLHTTRSVFIAARPEVVWHHINFPLNIKPSELRQGWAYRIGVPYPIEARTLEGRVGGRRSLQWERGVRFEEIITAWQPNSYIAWEYKFQPRSFPPGSLDEHIVIGGRYFNLETTSYRLVSEPGGTRLYITVGTSVSTTFNWYAGPWAKFLIGDTAEAILHFYKARAERPIEPRRRMQASDAAVDG